MHPLGHAQAEGVSLAVAGDNSGDYSGGACLVSDPLHNLYGVSGLQNNRPETNLFLICTDWSTLFKCEAKYLGLLLTPE